MRVCVCVCVCVCVYVCALCVYMCAGVWGYDQHTVQVLQRMQQESISQTTPTSSDSPTDNGQDAAEKVWKVFKLIVMISTIFPAGCRTSASA